MANVANVAVVAKGEAPEEAAMVTAANFRSWKRKHGRDTAFVVFAQEADEDAGDGVLVCTFSDMSHLPAGNYRAQLVQRCAIPDAAKKRLRGTDLWRCM